MERSNSLTCNLVDEDPGGDDASVLREKLLQLLLRHGLGQTAHVQISVSDGGRTRTGVGHLTAQHARYTRLNNKTAIRASFLDGAMQRDANHCLKSPSHSLVGVSQSTQPIHYTTTSLTISCSPRMYPTPHSLFAT